MNLFEYSSIGIKQIFLIDGIGALFSSFMLGFVLVQFESFFGIPKSALYVLASFPILFALFDFIIFIRGRDLKIPLIIIALLNGFYCVLSIFLAFQHITTVTFWGWTYLIIEIIIVLLLALIEFRLSNSVN